MTGLPARRAPSFERRARRCEARAGACRRGADEGFTLVELLIVITIIPLIIGAISLGLISVFQLQPSVQNRIGDTADSQVVLASFQNDVQSAIQVTTDQTGTITPSCSAAGVSGTRILGLMAVQGGVYGYQTIITYELVPDTTKTSLYDLERIECTNSQTNGVATVLARDIAQSQVVVNVACVPSELADCTVVSTSYVATVNVSDVTLQVEAQGSQVATTDKYLYTLAASPADSQSTPPAGTPNAGNTTTTTCNFASAGTGTYASTMCFVDFSNVTGAAMQEATGGGCLEMSGGTAQQLHAVLLPEHHRQHRSALVRPDLARGVPGK